MREVIEALLATEAEARRIVQAARGEAEGILSEARKTADALHATARVEARRDARNAIDAAIKAAQEERRRRQDAAVTVMEQHVQLDTVLKNSLVEAVVRCISENR
jgi:vacuolar-type H+-ATPase subunit H